MEGHTVNTHLARGTAAVGGSLLGLLLLAGPTSAKDIGPGDALPGTTSSASCRNVVPEDRAACQGAGTTTVPRSAPASIPDLHVEGGLLGLEPGQLGVVVLGAAALAGAALVTTRHRHPHASGHRPA
ncbi:hypothetical protein KLO01_19770 [Knoellia locipacati]|uniref:Uncharacterized protein n=1 Tax=Knoellia locipacati TaxID=882824 RepID=A0A512T161_9MICO|nr:hypothetical protein KLO01_19770 [Knoellia locipacati]